MLFLLYSFWMFLVLLIYFLGFLRISELVPGEATETHTQAAIIDLDGKFYTDPPYIQAERHRETGEKSSRVDVKF